MCLLYGLYIIVSLSQTKLLSCANRVGIMYDRFAHDCKAMMEIAVGSQVCTNVSRWRNTD
jgi:hypothetical protein